MKITDIESAFYNEFGGIVAVLSDGGERHVPDDMENLDRQELAVWEGNGGVISECVEPEAPPYQVFRSTFVSRMTNAEATTLEAAVAAAEPKLRLLFQAVEYFSSDDPLFAVLHWTVAVALGSESAPNTSRADDLLMAG